MKIATRLGWALIVIASSATAAQAGSIWARATHRQQMPYADDTARDVGDLLTVVINERSVIENETNRNLEKKDERSASVSSNIDLLRGLNDLTGKLFSIPDMNLQSSADSKFEGKADFDTDRAMTDKITVTVEDVLPNGNLVILGTRQRDVEGQAQTIQVSGIVRPSDIAFDNTVASQKVAEFHVVFKSAGHENRFTKPGWLAWILNVLNPF
jgi:flagellar L-ring protein precursor FlgH